VRTLEKSPFLRKIPSPRFQISLNSSSIQAEGVVLTMFVNRIYEDLYKDLTNRNALLSKDPSSSRPLDLPLYLLNLERDALLSSIEMHWEYRHSSLIHLHALERQRIEDDHRKGRELVRQRLLDGVEERRRKIREDKESVGDIVAGE
jgi:hypothetical protein